jgi:hypothetical protein
VQVQVLLCAPHLHEVLCTHQNVLSPSRTRVTCGLLILTDVWYPPLGRHPTAAASLEAAIGVLLENGPLTVRQLPYQGAANGNVVNRSQYKITGNDRGDPRKAGAGSWYGNEGVLRKPGAFCICPGLADLAEFAWAGAPVATSSAIVAAKQIILPDGRMCFLREIRFFIVFSFFLGAERRFLPFQRPAIRGSRPTSHY